MNFKVVPDTTHALLVGIGSYALGPGWDLPKPPEHAIGFAEWLLQAGIPTKNIYLFLDVQSQETFKTRLSTFNVYTAERQQFDQFIEREFSVKSGSLLYFFWSGHGVRGENDNRVLLFADWTRATPERHLDFTNFALRLSRVQDGKNFPFQIGYVDACAIDYNTLNFARSLGRNEYGLGQKTPMQQLIFFAEGRKQVRSGEFSQNVLSALKEEFERNKEVWPPSPRAIVTAVMTRFQGRGQQPVQLNYETRLGDKETFEVTGTDVSCSPFINSAGERSGYPISHFRRLARLAALQPKFNAVQARNELYSRLRAAPPTGLEERPPETDPESDLLHIVAAAFYASAQDVLKQEFTFAPDLISELERIEILRTIRRAIEKINAAPKVSSIYGTVIKKLSLEPERVAARSLATMLDQLCSAGNEPLRSVYEFALRIARAFEGHDSAVELRNIVRQHAPTGLEQAVDPERFHLHICAPPPGSGKSTEVRLFACDGSLVEDWSELAEMKKEISTWREFQEVTLIAVQRSIIQ